MRIYISYTCWVIASLFTGQVGAAEVSKESEAMAASLNDTLPNADSITGLWGAVKLYPPSGSFEVRLRRDGDNMLVTARDETLRIPAPKSDQLHFEFPHGTGAFRGTYQGKRKQYVGHWLSEPATMSYSHFASPLTLEQRSKDTWTGTATSPEQRFSIYISINQGADGKLSAFLRNPERNQGVSTRLHSVHRAGTKINFVDANGDSVLSGQFDTEHQTLSIFLPSRGGTYDLTRLNRADAPGFVPRREQKLYTYRSPADQQDGWQVKNAANSGLATNTLESLVQKVIDTIPVSIRTPSIHSLLVAHRGNLVLEEYFHGYYAERLHDLRSATKSVTGIMTGIALHETKSLDLNSSVYDQFDAELAATETNKSAITVEHLLNMNSGFHCDDNDEETPGNEDRMQSQSEQTDWWSYVLALPTVRPPGTRAAYCSAGINLLGGVIAEATGEWLPEFFRSRLASPLQIDHYQMNLDPLLRGYAGGGIHMRPRDFLKFGQLMLDGGKWSGKQVIPKQWAKQSLQARVSINGENDYGYTWWVDHLPYKDRTVETFSATGNGGQMLILIPELELLVGFTGGNYGDYQTWSAWRDELVPRYLLTALTE